MTQYDKVLWLDGDVFVNKNMDHLLFYPDFTSAFTQDCCNRAAQPRPSGGFWMLQPSGGRMAQIEALDWQRFAVAVARAEVLGRPETVDRTAELIERHRTVKLFAGAFLKSHQPRIAITHQRHNDVFLGEHR